MTCHLSLTSCYNYTAQLLQLDRRRLSTERSVPAVIAGVSSPLSSNLHAWQERLRSHPDQDFATFILTGLEQGFRVGFDYRSRLSTAKHNMPSGTEHPEVVECYLGEERSAGRIPGPLPGSIVPTLQVNRFGVIPKGRTSGKWTLITDL